MIQISAVPSSRDEMAHLGEDLRLDRDVERGRRLVGDDHRRAVQERDRDRDALAHAAGELVRIGVEPARRVGNARPSRAPRSSVPGRRFARRGSCAAIASRIWSAMVSTGFSVIIGSWNTIAMRRPRTRRSASFGEADELLALEPDRAGDDPAGRIDEAEEREAGDALARARIRRRARAPRPARASNDTPSTAFTTPALVKKWVARFETSRTGAVIACSLGLSWSRIWSPTRLIATIRTISAMPG